MKPTNCQECQFEPINKHAQTCSKYVELKLTPPSEGRLEIISEHEGKVVSLPSEPKVCDHSVKEPCGEVIQHTVVGTITYASEKSECVMHNQKVREEMLKTIDHQPTPPSGEYYKDNDGGFHYSEPKVKCDPIVDCDGVKHYHSDKGVEYTVPCDKPTVSLEDWEEEFDKLDWRIWNTKTSTYILIPENNRKFYKAFITDLLTSTREDEKRLIAEKVEGMKSDNTEKWSEQATNFLNICLTGMEEVKTVCVVVRATINIEATLALGNYAHAVKLVRL